MGGLDICRILFGLYFLVFMAACASKSGWGSSDCYECQGVDNCRCYKSTYYKPYVPPSGYTGDTKQKPNTYINQRGKIYNRFGDYYIDQSGNALHPLGDWYIDNKGDAYVPLGDWYIDTKGNLLMPLD